ncbi:HD domain-containing protein, partial [bacterium]|nr:HD domain-containing protein [bacterium]
MTMEEANFSLFLKALKFAANKHKNQRRKGEGGAPYINHPVQVADLLWNVGKVREPNILISAILHDTIEDTQTSPEEISELFGNDILSIVKEVTDDKSLPKSVRK